jgi:hypothetical protein
MSAFEAASWSWYHDSINPFTMESGAVGDLIRDEGLKDGARKLFLRALGLIHEVIERVNIEKTKAQRQGG